MTCTGFSFEARKMRFQVFQNKNKNIANVEEIRIRNFSFKNAIRKKGFFPLLVSIYIFGGRL